MLKVGMFMHYKRKEPFRYQFLEPLDGSFILMLNHDDDKRVLRTERGELKVIDISPRGIRFMSSLNIPVDKKDFLVEASFKLNDDAIIMLGKVAWKEKIKESYFYGIEGFPDPEREQVITDAVKSYNKKRLDGGGLV